MWLVVSTTPATSVVSSTVPGSALCVSPFVSLNYFPVGSSIVVPIQLPAITLLNRRQLGLSLGLSGFDISQGLGKVGAGFAVGMVLGLQGYTTLVRFGAQESLGAVRSADEVRQLVTLVRERAGSEPVVVALAGDAGGKPKPTFSATVRWGNRAPS